MKRNRHVGWHRGEWVVVLEADFWLGDAQRALHGPSGGSDFD